MIAPWLVALTWVALAGAFVSAVWIVIDIYALRYRQPMKVMEAVWPVTALYFGPAAVWAYRAWGRPKTQRWRAEHSDRPNQPRYASTAVSVSHCGAGCTLGDIVAELVIFAIGATIAGVALPAEYIGDYVAAVGLGIVFQYFAIASMRGLSLRAGLIEAAKADVASLTAFEVGLFCWMALVFLVFFPAPRHLMPSSPTYWFLMQVGMVAGFFTSWPVNSWLVRAGIKEAM